MKHHIVDDWIDKDKHFIIECKDVYDWISYKRMKPDYISNENIKCNNLDLITNSDARYIVADLNLPGIVVELENHYRMIDGRHRLKKSLDQGKDTILTYVLTEKQALKFIKPV